VRNLATGRTWAICRSAAGGLGDNESELEAVSPDGRFIVYRTLADNLVAGDTNRAMDVLVYDRATGRTTRVDVSSAGAQAPAGASGPAAISDDGRVVAFQSTSSGLVPGLTGGLFARDMRSRRTWRLDPTTGAFALAGDGASVVLSTSVAGGGGLTRISVAGGRRTVLPLSSATGLLLQPSLSSSGSALAFFSTATDLPAGPAGSLGQVYAARLPAVR
jgi:Tol biopolymer transport system component